MRCNIILLQTNGEKMFTFKLPTYEELKQNYETYLKDVQKFYKDWYSDIQKTFNK